MRHHRHQRAPWNDPEHRARVEAHMRDEIRQHRHWHEAWQKHAWDEHHGRRRRPLTLHRVLLTSSLLSIAITAAVIIAVMGGTADEHAWWREMGRVQTFASSQIARTWNDESARSLMLTDAARTFDARVILRDLDDRVLFDGGPADVPCGSSFNPAAFRFDVVAADGHKLGRVIACRVGEHAPPWRGALAIGATLCVLWLVSAIVARKTARPIRHLVDVAKRIGDGDLRARPQVGRRAVLEVRALADALGEMADRIETQLKDQRALLAGASHEMRTPLGHLRILVELLRQQPSDKVISDVEREVVEMDALIEKLLASSRLDFSLADKRDVDCADLARRALERSGEPVAKLNIVDDTNTHVHGDPTLLLGAVTNLVENAKSHGIELVALTVEQRGDELAFIVDDKGPGIAAEDADKVFEPFFHRARGDGAQGSLGLGLSLVKRIAEAHGGRAFAASHDDAPGARVGFTVLRG